jgi:hypothetical protein
VKRSNEGRYIKENRKGMDANKRSAYSRRQKLGKKVLSENDPSWQKCLCVVVMMKMMMMMNNQKLAYGFPRNMKYLSDV